jgi:hypothetical protein
VGVYDALKDAVRLAQVSDNAALIQSLNGALIQVGELIEQNTELRAKVRELEEKLATKGAYKTIRVGHATVVVAEGDESTYYCATCFATRKQTIPLQKHPIDDSFGSHFCNVCSGSFDLA